MFTIISSALCCSAPEVKRGNKIFQREKLQNIASAIDIILGVGLIVAGFMMNMPALYLVGGLQLWPLFAFITIALFSVKQGLGKETFYLRFNPCCSGADKTKRK